MQTPTWQWHLQHAIRDLATLADHLNLDIATMSDSAIDPAATGFPLLVPQPFLDRMEPGNPNDPLLLQVLPRKNELDTVANYVSDPLQELKFTDTTKGLIQKYQGRVLIMTTGACAVNCRYCFRRHFPYQDHQPSQSDWRQIFRHIKDDDSISEVILSGGDPLVMNDEYIARIIASLDDIDHVDTIRFHTRLPVVIPQRVSDELLSTLAQSAKKIVMVMHTNHANEIDDHVAAAAGKLSAAGVTLLNQTVLLRGINDSDNALCVLSRALFGIGVLPYYLHLFDPVAGAAHFDSPQSVAVDLMESMTHQLPGYLVPRLVREVPGAAAKQLQYRA